MLEDHWHTVKHSLMTSTMNERNLTRIFYYLMRWSMR